MHTYSRAGKRSATVRVARWSAHHPWRAIVLWVVFVGACVAGGQLAGTKSATAVDLGVGQSGKATAIRTQAGLAAPATEQLYIGARTGRLDLASARAAATEAAAELKGLAQVASVGGPVMADDRSAIMLTVTMSGDQDTASDRVDAIQRVTDHVAKDNPQLRVEEAGDASIDKGVNDEVSGDLGKAENLSLPITLLIMLVAFGAIIAAGVPVLLAVSAVGSAMGLAAVASQVIPSVDTVNSMILLIGMAVGVDYSLFYLKREREERAKGRSKMDAIEIAAATSGHSVMVSGMAVVVAMAGLFIADDAIFSSLATGSLIVVAVAMIGSVTVLPALLAKLGRRVDRPRLPVLWRLTNRPDREPKLWPALLKPALKHPVQTLMLSVIALVALAGPALGMTLRSSDANDIPRTVGVMTTYDRINKAFPSETTSHQVVVRAAAADAPRVIDALRTLQDRASRDARFTREQRAPVQSSADGTVHIVDIDTSAPVGSKAATQSLDRLRDSLLPDAVGQIKGAWSGVDGDTAEDVDYAHHAGQKVPWVIGFVLVLTLIVMMVSFRSVVLAFVSVGINLLSVSASFGLLTLVFQHGFANGLLHITDTRSGVIAWIPIFLFVVLFGLSMDYHVFVLTRIREAVQRGMSTRDAVRTGITHSAGVVTSAAVVMISVFAVFGTLSMVEFKQMGVGLTSAILIDAVVVRIILLPALMALLGRANWWPSRLSRKVPDRRVLDESANGLRSEEWELVPQV